MINNNFWNQYSEGLHIEWAFSISKKDMRQFSELSGDKNPIHTDLQYAQGRGFKNSLVYGLLLCAQMSRLVGEEMPDKNSIIISVQMDFLSPCFPNDNLIFSADLSSKSDSTRTYKCKCKIIKNNTIMCKGIVEALWKP